MKRFRFPLQPVAALRAHRELQAKEIFAAAVQAYVKTQEDLAHVRARVAGIEAALTAGRRGSFSASEQAQTLFAYRQECTVEAEAERTVQTARNAMELRRAEYVAAHRQMEIVRRLEEKARAAHRDTAARAEQAESDDFASQRAARNSFSKL